MQSDAEARPAQPETANPPAFLYGTAWKEERTEALTLLALQLGFRGIDTANQRKHYHEAGVGAAITTALDEGLISRAELFLQTKFTYRGGQDHRLPYDPAAPVAEQVRQSFALSLVHLRTDYLDSYVLHGPSRRHGLADMDWQVWQAMERLVVEGKVKRLGVSNIADDQLAALCAGAEVKPAFVQNRCYARLGWDADVRQICKREQIRYQGFSLLTANREVFAEPAFRAITSRHQRSGPQIVFRFALDVGMLPLTGTSSAEHMREDLAALEFELSEKDVQTIERIAVA